ncbi:CRISPR-associated protein Cas4 [Runella sp.]|uniref:CRISPR-associated protein Cas4 n=1 Tax=Runella sp. TaxID=1960881 RepID=UPI003017F943
MPINATLINLYHVCRRELWLHAHEIRMEHNSDTVYEGKLIGENSYAERADKNRELELTLPDGLGAIKIDFYDAVAKTVHETKKSDKAETAHIAQVKFYLWALEQCGIEGAQGIIEYPRLRTREHVALDAQDRLEISNWVADIQAIIESDTCPPVLRKPICRSCSYYDFCYMEEVDG